jgi:hypothetical protein
VPKETGIAKHPLFCLKRKKKKTRQRRATKRDTNVDTLARSDTASFLFEG